jgi:hypothetical protein
MLLPIQTHFCVYNIAVVDLVISIIEKILVADIRACLQTHQLYKFCQIGIAKSSETDKNKDELINLSRV